MQDRTLGFKTTGCLGGMMAVFAFFAYLLHSVQDIAEEARKTRSTEPTIQATAGPSEENGTISVINSARLASLLSAAKRYSKDHQGLLPPMDSPEALQASLFPHYVTGEGVFRVPQGGKPYLPNPALSRKPLKVFTKPAEVIAFYEPLDSNEAGDEKGRTVVFLNGNQRKTASGEWNSLRKKAGLP